MKKILSVLTLLVSFAWGAVAQNYSTVTITPQNGVLVVNGINQISIPNYDPSEVQLEPISGSVAVPSAAQMYTIAEYPTLNAVWNTCSSSSTIWASNLVTLDTYSGQTANTGYAALLFAGSPISCGYAKFDKTVSGAWTEFGYFTTNSGINEQTLSVSVTPNPVSDELNIHHVAGAQISIYCLNGQEMKRIEKADMNEVINISGWSAGVYVVRCTFEGYVSMVKFVKE
jgi:hypothetical protein